MRRVAIALVTTGLLFVGTGGLASDESGGLTIYESTEFWLADARFETNRREHVGDADHLGLVVGLRSGEEYWVEGTFLTGERIYPFAGDAPYVRDATGAFGWIGETIDVGIGVQWQSHTYCSYTMPAWGPLGVVRFHRLLGDRSVSACATVSLAPVCFGDAITQLEYVQVQAGLAHFGSGWSLEIGYRWRLYYNFSTHLNLRGIVLRLGINH